MDKLIVDFAAENALTVTGNGGRLATPKVSDGDFEKFGEWTASYNRVLKGLNNEESLLSIGRDMYVWLNGNGWLDGVLKNPPTPLIVEFRIPQRASEVHKAFIEAPWELLADGTGHLAKDAMVQFSPVRRIGGGEGNGSAASQYKLTTLFMAAAPVGVQDDRLDYEAEESAILHLHSESGIDMELFVEESGNLKLLTEHVNRIKPAHVVHISCHGNNEPGPRLALETETGDLDRVKPDRFTKVFSQNKPYLLFLSACKTSGPDKVLDTFSQTCVKHGFPAVLGWSGSVGDSGATRFAAEFYRNLSQSATIEDAVARARFFMASPSEGEGVKREVSEDWHLARLYLGSGGGGVVSTGERKLHLKGPDAGAREFLDKKKVAVPVASRAEFVGRRRHIQRILKSFGRKGGHAGVLIHGMGNQGKSSLAARIANRMHGYETLVVFGDAGVHYDAYAILSEFKIAAKKTETDKRIATGLSDVQADPSNLYSALKELLGGPFSGRSEQERPVLLVIDDFEKNLSKPAGGEGRHSVNLECRVALNSVIRAFKDSDTQSRLIITSRFDFDSLDEMSRDVAGKLVKVSLSSMNEAEAKKQYVAKYGGAERGKTGIKLDMERVIKACGGNPGLQNLMFGLFNESPETWLRALEAMENYIGRRESAGEDEEENIRKFLENLAMGEILDLLTEGEKELLRVGTFFEIPVPADVFDAIRDTVGIQKDVDYKTRLLGLGVLESFEDLADPKTEALFVNSILRPKLPALVQKDIEVLSPKMLKPLAEKWLAGHVAHRPWHCDKELLKLGLILKNAEVVGESVESCIRGMHKTFLTKHAVPLAHASIELLERDEGSVPAGLYQVASDVCHQVGEVAEAGKYIGKAIENTDKTEDNLFEVASSLLRQGRILIQQGKPDEAIGMFEQANFFFRMQC